MLRPPACPHALCAACADATWMCVPPVCTLCGEAAPKDGGWVPLESLEPRVRGEEEEEEEEEKEGRAAMADVQARFRRVAEAAQAARDTARLWAGAGLADGLQAVLAEVDAEERARLKALGAQTDELQVRLALLACPAAADRLDFSGLGGRPVGPPVSTYMYVVVVDRELRLRRGLVDPARCVVRTRGLVGPAGQEAAHDPLPEATKRITVEVELADEFGHGLRLEDLAGHARLVASWRGRDMGVGTPTGSGAVKFCTAAPAPAGPAAGQLVVTLVSTEFPRECVVVREVSLEDRRTFEAVLETSGRFSLEQATFVTSSADGWAFACACQRGYVTGNVEVRLGDGREATFKQPYAGPEPDMLSARFGPAPTYALFVLHRGSKLRRLVMAPGGGGSFEPSCTKTTAVPLQGAECLAVADSCALAVGSAEGCVACFSYGEHGAAWTTPCFMSRPVRALDFSVGGRRLVVVLDIRVEVLDARDGSHLHFVSGIGSLAGEVRFCRNGQALVAGRGGSHLLMVLRDDLTDVQCRKALDCRPSWLVPTASQHAVQVYVESSQQNKVLLFR